MAAAGEKVEVSIIAIAVNGKTELKIFEKILINEYLKKYLNNN